MFEVRGYYDNDYQGLEDDFSSENFDEVLSAAHELAARGDFILVRNDETGNEVRMSSDEWVDAIDRGDYPDEVKALWMEEPEISME